MVFPSSPPLSHRLGAANSNTPIQQKIATYLDDVFIQDTTTDIMLQISDKSSKILKKENFSAAPDKSFFF